MSDLLNDQVEKLSLLNNLVERIADLGGELVVGKEDGMVSISGIDKVDSSEISLAVAYATAEVLENNIEFGSYEERRENRIERYKANAFSIQRESDNLWEESHKMLSMIPPGQPILVGHHSEGRHRNHLNRSWGKLGKSIQMEEKAKYYKSRAEFAESNRAISSSDPEAITKLREKIAALKSNQQYMKDANKIIRKKISDDEKIELIIKLGVSREVAEKALKPNVVGQIGFAGYKLTNNGATIRAAEKRLALLEEQEEIKFSVKIYDGFMFVVNPFVSRVQFIFDGKPEDSVRNILKGEAFRWSPKANAWQFNLNPRGLYRSEQIIKELTKKNDSE